VKPENILLGSRGGTTGVGHLRVADFGVARAVEAAGAGRLTETGLVVGTPAYMSPEQAGGEPVDARADIYALGCVLYEMLAGEPPYTGPTAQAILAKRLSDPIPSLRRIRETIPEALDSALAKSLARTPADRFRTAADFARALASDREARARETPSRRRVAAARAMAIGLGLLALVAVATVLWERSHRSTGPTAPHRLAVLPFENLGDSADAYFADGITDEVRGKLSAVSGMRVIARSSTSEYRGTRKSPRQIGRELGADYLLTATVRWDKNQARPSRVRVNPELIRASDGTTRWQQPFDAALTDVFQVQADIAGRVAQALDLALGSGERERLEVRPTANLAAYDAYLRGEEVSAGIARSDPATLRRAIAHYEQAVALDPGFAPAWARLSQAHSYLYGQAAPTPQGRQSARLAAERALAVAPDRPEGRRALGDYHARVSGDYALALEQYAQGRRIAPSDAELLVGSARAERSLGRWEAALEHLLQARTLDPRSASTADALVLTLLYLRRYPEALEASDRALAQTPASMDLLEDKAMVHLARGDLAAARGVLRAAPPDIEPAALAAFLGNYWDLFWVLEEEQQQLLLRLTPGAFDDSRSTWAIVLAQTHALRRDQRGAPAHADSPRPDLAERLRVTPDAAQLHLFYGLALAYLGRKEEAIREGEHGLRLEPVSRNAFDGPYFQHQLARIYLTVGVHDKALDQLERLLEIPYYLSPGWLRIDPAFDPIRDHPRFRQLIAGD
jgi:serine/threonine-protein kinase